MKYRKIFFVAITCFGSICTFAQSPQPQKFLPSLTPSSPEAAAFNRYGNYQVNLFTGIPEISIPLYEIKIGELSVPVSLNYHSSGIKVSDMASRVGLGWDLQAGGTISRKVMGLPDELPNNYLSATPTSEFRVKTGLEIDPTTEAGLTYLANVDQGMYDVEPDIFSYSFPGHSGKFLFNQKNNFTPVLIPYAPVTVNKVTSLGNLALDMTDESGINYKFGQTEFTNSGTGKVTICTSAWLLSDMISANKQDSIHFLYSSRTGGGITDAYLTDFLVLNDNCTGSYNGAGCTTTGQFNTDAGTTLTDWKQLNEIDFKNGKVVFEAGTETREDFSSAYNLQKRLNDIKIYNYDLASNSYTLIRSVYFFQSYFINGSDNSTKRLKLDSIQVKMASGEVVQTYKFNYNTAVALPAKLSRMKDYWGYFNNITNLDPFGNPTSIAKMQVQYSAPPNPPTTIWIGGDHTNARDPDPNYMQADILQKITFPTGGYTQFEYETNQYLDDQSNPKYAGGLRIKSIKNYTDNNATPIVKTYKYGTSESGYGRNNFLLEDHFFFNVQNLQKQRDIDPTGHCTTAPNTETTRTFFANPTNDLESYDGAPVVYPVVTEYIGDNTTNVGKTIYNFADKADAKTSLIGYGKSMLTSYHFVRGMLTNKLSYRINADNSYSIISEDQKTYQYFPFQNTTGGIGLAVFKFNIFEGFSGLYWVTPGACDQGTDTYAYKYNNYEIVSGDNKLVTETSIVYDQNDPTKYVSTITNYTYDDLAHLGLTQTQTFNSKNETLYSNYTYPYNFSTTPYSTMDANHIWNKTITDTKLNGTAQLTKQTNNYTSFGSNNFLIGNIQFQTKSYPVETRANFNNYDKRGNILDMQKTNDLKQSFMWDSLGLQLIATASNAANTYRIDTILTPGTNTGFLTWSAGVFNTASATFTQASTGNITLNFAFGQNPGSAIVTVTYTLSGPSNQSGTLCITGTGTGCSNPSTVTFSNMPPGLYTISATPNSSFSIGTSLSYLYQTIISTPTASGIREIFYTGFEDNPAAISGNAHTGKKYWTGNYPVPFLIPNGRNYIIQWWSYNGAWNFHQQAYAANTTLTGTIDDVRVFPSDGQLVSYTYSPLVGMTSQTDHNGKTIYYEYDNFQRLKNIKDDKGNIVKNFQYNYMNSCGTNCFVLPMQTFSGGNTLSYPVGVFNANGKLLGNATTQTQYISLWNADTANQHRGTLAAGSDSMHFKLTVISTSNIPSAVTGCRYYQADLPWNQMDGVRNINGCYVDFGDGTGMRLGKTSYDTVGITLPSNTVLNYAAPGSPLFANFNIHDGPYYIHTYPDSTLKTLTFYHNDGIETPDFDSWTYPANSLFRIKNFRGYYPQNMQFLGGTSYQQASANSVANISNWNSISTITTWYPYAGLYGNYLDPCRNMSYAQDFMQNNRNLTTIRTGNGSYYTQGYSDTTFKLSKLKTNWTTYFTNLSAIAINEDHWNHEDLSVIYNLSYINLTASNQNHSNIQTGNPLIPISTTVIDNIFNQIASGPGQHISNGTIIIQAGGTTYTNASLASVNFLKSKGWTIIINSVVQ